MVRSSYFTKRFTTAMPMELYNTIDRLVDNDQYASIPHALRSMVRTAIKRSRKAKAVYYDECAKLGFKPEL